MSTFRQLMRKVLLVVLVGVLAPACDESEYDIFYSVEARDAGGPCSPCEASTLALVGIASTDSPEEIVLSTDCASLIEHVKIWSEEELVKDFGFVCLTVEGTWPVKRGAPAEAAVGLGETDAPEGNWEPLPTGSYTVEIQFATEEGAFAVTEFQME